MTAKSKNRPCIISSQGSLEVCVFNHLDRNCAVFGLLASVDGFNRGNGHIKYLSNCLQHAVSATDSLLINVENCSVVSASTGQQHSIYFEPPFFSSSKNSSNVSNSFLTVCFLLLLFQIDFPILERAVVQFKVLLLSGNPLCWKSDGVSVCVDNRVGD